MAHDESADDAIMRAAKVAIDAVKEASRLKPADELEAGAVSVKVAGEWFGYEGLDSKGRMVLWSKDQLSPFYYGPSEGEVFCWRPLIGDAS